MVKKIQLNPIKKFLRKNDSKNPNSAYTIYFRLKVIHDGLSDQFEISSRVSVPTKRDWSKHEKLIKGNCEKVRRLNKALKDKESIIEEIWEKIKTNDNASSILFQAKIYEEFGINRKGFEHVTKTETILELFDHCAEMKKTVIGEIRKGRYKVVKERMAIFLTENYHTPEVKHTFLNSIFYYKFKNFLAERYFLNPSTLESQMKVLKAVANQAEISNLIQKNPFLGCKSPKIKYKPRALKFEDYIQLENLPEAELSDELKEIKMWFLIQCNTGLSYCDLKRIPTTVQKNGDQYFIFDDRDKTDNPFGVWVRPNVLELLKKLCELNRVKNYASLKAPTLNKMNLKLKILAAMAGLKVNLTTHVGRHTYGSTYIQNGGSLQSLSDNMGHSNLEQTRHYGRNNNDSITTESEMVYERINKKKILHNNVHHLN